MEVRHPTVGRAWQGQIRLLRGHQDEVHTLAFSPDGASLISGSDDETVLSWDVADVPRRRPAGKELSAAQLADLWTNLASKDAARPASRRRLDPGSRSSPALFAEGCRQCRR